jgi:hypothetical protein
MRFDLLVSDDGTTVNDNWDGFWDARTSVTPEGWFAEVRIPFSTLGFISDPDGDVVMGLTVTRLVSRLGERVTFPAIDPAFTFRRPSLAQDIAVSGIHIARPDTFGYRTGKFVTRNRWALAASVAIAASLVAGTIVSVSQARRAERRFNQVRQIANALMYDVHDEIRQLPGSTTARQKIVATAL